MHLRHRETHGANGDKPKHELEKLKDARTVKIQHHHHECNDPGTVASRRHRGVRGVKKARRLNHHVHADAKNIQRRAQKNEVYQKARSDISIDDLHALVPCQLPHRIDGAQQKNGVA